MIGTSSPAYAPLQRALTTSPPYAAAFRCNPKASASRL